MTSAIRWRVIALQIVLVGVLGFTAGFAYWASGFTHSYVHDELTSQQITFPAAGNAALKALPPADAAAMSAYAGQQLTTGEQAQTYANHFIAVHLGKIGGGKTYSQVSALAQAQPTNTALAEQANTLFKGETLRGLLLNAWGWWTVGTYAFYAAIGLMVAGAAVLAALLFEAVVMPRRAPVTAGKKVQALA